MGDYKVISTLYGKYGVYEIRRYYRVVFNDDYIIYKDGSSWKSASSPESAYRIIKKYDPKAS